MTVIGNPVRNNEIVLNISSDRQGQAELHLLDIKGRTMLIQKQSLTNGNNIVRLTSSGGYLAAGTYVVKAIINGQLFVEKIMVSR